MGLAGLRLVGLLRRRLVLQGRRRQNGLGRGAAQVEDRLRFQDLLGRQPGGQDQTEGEGQVQMRGVEGVARETQTGVGPGESRDGALEGGAARLLGQTQNLQDQGVLVRRGRRRTLQTGHRLKEVGLARGPLGPRVAARRLQNHVPAQRLEPRVRSQSRLRRTRATGHAGLGFHRWLLIAPANVRQEDEG